MYISLTNTIGAIRTAIGIVKKNLQLWLDFNKSEVIGSEEVVNGDFTEGLTGWDNGSVTELGGVVTFLSDVGYIYQNKTFATGSSYKVVLDGLGDVRYRTGTSGSAATYISITLPSTLYFTATTDSSRFQLRGSSPFTAATTSNISVKEVTQFVKDKSPNTNNAKLFTGKALSFNGNDSVDIGGFTSGGGELTMAVWVFINGVSTNKVIMEKISPNRFIFRINGSTVEVYDGSVRTFGSIDANKYQRLSLTVTSSEMKCYVNNVQLGATITNHNAIDLSSISNCRIGSDQLGTGQFFDGNLSDFQIYNKAWTASDVAFDYNNPNHLAIDNPDTDLVVADLKGYWALSEGDGLVAYDSSGEGNNGTINGATYTYTPAQDTIPQLGMMDWAKGSNLLDYSQDFSQWALVNSTILSENTTSPDGTVNAYRITSTSNGDSAFVRNTSATQIVSTTYSYSCFVKKGTTNYVRLANRAIGTASESSAWFDIENGVVGTLGSSLTSSNIESYGNGWYRCTLIGSTGSSIPNQLNDIAAATSDGLNPAQLGDYIYYWGAQLEESSSAGNYILTDGAAAIDVTTIQNPTNKGYDILGNALRLREHAFNLDGSGYAEVADDATLNISNGTLQFWLKTSDTKFNILSGQSTSEFIGTTDNSVWSFGNAGTITSYIGAATANTQPLYDGNWSFYTFTGVDLSTWTAIEISNLAGFELDGLLDEVMIYSSVLTIKEIKNNYNIGINKHKATSSFSDDFSSDYGI